MSDFKKKVEAILFASGKHMRTEDIAKICRTNPENVDKQLKELKKHYDSLDSSLVLENEGPIWKLTIKEEFAHVTNKLISEAELSKTVMESLAIIAWKAPVLQSDVIKVRTNKAYDHLKELEEAGFITRQRHGRTKLIKLSERFFNYFDVRNAQALQDKFKVDDAQKELRTPEQNPETTENNPEQAAEVSPDPTPTLEAAEKTPDEPASTPEQSEDQEEPNGSKDVSP